jgi:hypothetical protein
MANTVSISPKPGIKCYAGKLCDTLLYTTAKTTPENIRKLTNEDLLWTGESVYCICSHHVEQHSTVRDQYGCELAILCHGNNGSCNCTLFRTCSIRLSHSNCYKMVTEGLADV